MHLSEEQITAFRDAELAGPARKIAAQHLQTCPSCATRMLEANRRADSIAHSLTLLNPPPSFQPSPHPAIHSFYNHRKENPMKSLFRRPAAILASLVVILVIALSFPNVQALAGSFLGLFRVQQVRVVRISPGSMERVNSAMENNSQQLETFFNQNLTLSDNGSMKTVETPEQAAALAGFTPRLPATEAVVSIGVNPAQTADLVIDSALMNTLLEAVGQNDVKIPANLDGEKIHADIPAAIISQIGSCPLSPDENGPTTPESSLCQTLIQFNSPTVQAPENFPIVQLAETALQVLGMDPAQAHQFSQSIDWASTLVLPIPTSADTIVADVTVDGVSATLISSNTNNEYALIWVKDGVVYALSGSGSSSTALQIANSIQ